MTARLRCAARLAGALLLLAGCGSRDAVPPRDPPLLLAAVDGLEWSVLLPLLRSGELPVLAELMRRGSYGRLASMRPTFSPVIWTTIATGVAPDRHGIVAFTRGDAATGDLALLTSEERRAAAFWNVASDAGRTVHVLGWWMTFPVEPIHGVMVAQTHTDEQMDLERRRAGELTIKGGIVDGVAGQVHPPELGPRVFEIAAAVRRELPDLTRRIFGAFPHPLSPLHRRLWETSLWSLRADAIYLRVARDLLDGGEPFDLLALYLGGADVIGHRFWRHHDPGSFRHRPSEAELASFGRVVADYYRHVDRSLGELVDALPPGASVVVLSDHGMQPHNRDERFDPRDAPRPPISGAHADAPPGVFVAAGPRFRAAAVPPPADPEAVPFVAGVLDVLPTLLAALALPVATDLPGEVREGLLAPAFLARSPVRYGAPYAFEHWIARRTGVGHRPGVEAERLEQLRGLGYLE